MKYIILFYLILVLNHTFSQDNNNFRVETLWIGFGDSMMILDSTIRHPVFRSDDAYVTRDKNEVYHINITNPNCIGKVIHIDLFDSTSTRLKKIDTYHYLVKKVPDPVFYIDGKLIHDTIYKSDLLKTKTIDVRVDDYTFPMTSLFELKSFDLEIDGKSFHSDSNKLTTSMISVIANSVSNTIRIHNDKIIMATPHSDNIARAIYKDRTFILSK